DCGAIISLPRRASCARDSCPPAVWSGVYCLRLDLALARSAEWQHLYSSQPAFRCGEKERRPCVECSAFLLCPIVPLINPNYASATSAQMIQHRLGDFEAHAEAL